MTEPTIFGIPIRMDQALDRGELEFGPAPVIDWGAGPVTQPEKERAIGRAVLRKLEQDQRTREFFFFIGASPTSDASSR